MGCGKSKHDVASDNVLQRKKSSASSMAGQENVKETKDTINNNVVDNVSNSEVQVEQKESENVKEFGVEAGKDDVVVVNDVKGEEAEKTNVEEEKKAEAEGGEGKTEKTIIAEEKPEKSEEGGKDDSLKENEQKTNDDDTDATEEKVQEENEKEDVSMKNEGCIKDSNV